MNKKEYQITMNCLIDTAVEKANVLGREDAQEDINKIKEMIKDLEDFWQLDDNDWDFILEDSLQENEYNNTENQFEKFVNNVIQKIKNNSENEINLNINKEFSDFIFDNDIKTIDMVNFVEKDFDSRNKFYDTIYESVKKAVKNEIFKKLRNKGFEINKNNGYSLKRKEGTFYTFNNIKFTIDRENKTVEITQDNKSKKFSYSGIINLLDIFYNNPDVDMIEKEGLKLRQENVENIADKIK
ncbi:MAG: hypothetical protein ACOCP8_07130 [archaeon]